MIPKHTPLPADQTFPHPTSTTSFWRSQPSPLDNYRSTPNLPTHVDIAIIGAGLSGISTAYHLLQQPQSTSTSTPSILILEARQLCSGATGRNGGHLKVATPAYTKLLESHGVTKARELAEFHYRQLYAMKDVVERERIDCDLLVTRSFDVFMDGGMAEEEGVKVRRLRDCGVEVARREVQVLGPKDVEAVTGVKGAAGARGVPAVSLWPYKFVCGLTERILDKVNLQTHTVVKEVAEKADGQGFIEVITTRGSLRARKVVYASNAYTAGLLPSITGVIVPWKGTASRVVRQPKKHHQQRTFTYNIWKDPKHVDYLNHRLDGGAIIGGAREVFENNHPLWLSTVDDSTLIEEKGCRKYFEQRMEEYYQDWTESGAEVQQIWTGIMGYTQDGYPLIGAVPDRQNQFILAGFNGAGMLNIFLSSEGVAKMMNGHSFAETGIPSFYQITKERLQEARNGLDLKG